MLNGPRALLVASLLALALLLAGCTTPKQLGERPAPTVKDAVEIYLQRSEELV